MKIAVTGAAGTLGRMVCAELAAAGHEVRGIDRQASDGILPVDLRDADATQAALTGCEAIVQLAAWPTPHSAPAATILIDNISIISNVLFSASALGVRRVIAASSQSVLGLPWAETVIVPEYLPVDEAHPCRPTDAYSVSKLASEEIAAMFSRRGELDVTMLRFPAIWDHEQFDGSIARRLQVPEQGAKSQWAYVDLRDAARAVRLALETTHAGLEIINIVAPEAFSPEPLEVLLKRWYPGLQLDEADRNASCFDFRRAEQVLGFRARFLWSTSGVRDSEPAPGK